MIISPRPSFRSPVGVPPAGGHPARAGIDVSTTAAEILVDGQVQGVGYRAFVERRASLLGLAGYVMNLADGRVRVYVEGDRAVIETFLAALARGPRLARVDRTEVRWVAPGGRFSGFAVRYPGRED